VFYGILDMYIGLDTNVFGKVFSSEKQETFSKYFVRKLKGAPFTANKNYDIIIPTSLL